MSTIKSSNEHLTLNADGSSKDIKFQANGVEKASLSSTGVFTAVSFAGSGSALTGVGVSGITSTADSTAITIDSAEQVTISNSNNGNNTVHIKALNATGDEANLRLSGNISGGGMGAGEVAGSLQYFNNTDFIASISGMRDGGNEGQLSFKTRGGSDSAPVEQLKITKDGRGLSEFTARVWVNFNGTGSVSIRDSHNVSSITDNGTGDYNVNFTNNLANSDYCAGAFNAVASSEKVGVNGEGVGTFRIRTGYGYYANFTYADRSLVKAVAFGGF